MTEVRIHELYQNISALLLNKEEIEREMKEEYESLMFDRV